MTKLLLQLLIALMFVCNYASAQERVKLPISASSKTLGYSPVWVAWRQGFSISRGSMCKWCLSKAPTSR